MAHQVFSYVARNDSGREVKGVLNADSESDATGKLRQQGLSVVSLAAKKSVGSMEIKLSFIKPSKKASANDLALFTRQLATMVTAGIPLLEGIEILAEQTMETNKGFGMALNETADSVRSGTSLSEAMINFPKVFPEIYINMIRAGEASGQIDAILDRLADYLERSEELKREIKSAMTYPVISLVMVVGITVYLLVGVVPKFQGMFDSLGAELPALTLLVIDVSNWMQTNLGTVAIATVVAVVAYKFLSKTRDGARILDAMKLRMPVFGPLGQKVAISRFSRTFSTLLSSGVPILGALEIVANTAGNQVISDAVLETRETVRAGENMSTHLATVWVFPPMVTKMIAIGERSGALEQLLSKVSDFYDQQVSATVKALTSLIEPIMIGIMGALVGTIVIAIFLPILELQKQLS